MAHVTKIQIINNALMQLRLPKINSLADLSMMSFPYNLINEFFADAIIFLSLTTNIEYLLEDKKIIFKDFNKASLEDNKIFSAKIYQVYSKKENSYYYPSRITAEDMKSYWNELERIGDVQNWSVINDNIHIAPQPIEKDIYIRHYKVLNILTTAIEEIDNIPEKYTEILIEFISGCLANLLGKETKEFYEMLETNELNSIKTNELNYLSFTRVMPSNISF